MPATRNNRADPQCRDNRRHRRGLKRIRPKQGVKEVEAVRADLGDKGVTPRLDFRRPHILDPPIVALIPFRRRKHAASLEHFRLA